MIVELELKILIDSILDKIKLDYESKVNKADSFLYRLLGTGKVGNYEFMTQAVEVFTKNNGSADKIETSIMFNSKRMGLPTIHVTIPSEEPYSDGLGYDEDLNEIEFESGDTGGQYYNRGFKSKFELVITGRNSFEVVLIYNVMKAALIANLMSLEANGFRQPKISGGDLRIAEQLSPNGFMRVLNLESFYDLRIPKFENIQLVSDINFNGKGYGNE